MSEADYGAVGTSVEAHAKPHGWHHGQSHHAMYRYGLRRHYGWNRGHHRGWYKHHRHHANYGGCRIAATHLPQHSVSKKA
ncbi:hypothetical protein AB4Z40_32710 [Bosea sp. 2YAB26]|jgi:hypothetical protein|uniref:hypothetical protein n=1 Tax=Bosea sp. 2YAB26 TaxID=3237478 RepID=UPI003F8E2E54